jgi:hypothetical protein
MNLQKTVDMMKQVFKDAESYNKKTRKHSAYMFLNTKLKLQALKNVSKELTVGGVKTRVLVSANKLFIVEPIFDNKGKYVCEELIYLGKMDDNKTVTESPINPNLF